MRALGKTPNDPLLHKMSAIQWRMCVLNVMEDEDEANKKISDLVDIAIRVFVGNPDKTEEAEGETQSGYIGKEPSINNPVVASQEGDKSVKKVLSTSFDKILESGGKYEGFAVEEVKEKPNA